MTRRLRNIVESLIFISTDPLSMEKIKTVCEDFPPKEVEEAVAEIVAGYTSGQGGLHVLHVAGGYLLATRPEYDPWIRRLLHVERKSKLSGAAVETLSTVAYHQPVTLAQISTLRGVDSTHALKTLLAKGLVKIVGRKKSPGKPLIYRTTDKFLTYFGLKSLDDLPSEEEIKTLLEEDEGG